MYKLLVLFVFVFALENKVATAYASSKTTNSTATVVIANPTLPIQIVTCHEGTDLKDLTQEFNLTPTFIYDQLGAFAAPMDTNTISRLKRDNRVRFVEADSPITTCEQTNGLGVIRMGITNFPVAHINGGDHRINVDVAILDTGIDTNHPDLNVYQTASFVEPGLNGNDWVGHGTHVAGIIGAFDNGFGVVGVAPGVRLWNVQVNGRTQATWNNALAGINYIASHTNEISIVNASFGSTVNSPIGAIRTAIQKLVSAGIVFIAAAGNNTNDVAGPDGIFGPNLNTFTCDDALPAALPEVMAVSAIDPSIDQIAPFSNFNGISRTSTTNSFANPNYYTNFVTSTGGAIDVAAPGVNILSTWTNGGYAYDSGTSMACPHVAGLVALYIAANGRGHSEADVYRIRQAIVDNSLPQSQWNTTNTLDPDSNPEPLAMPSENWIPKPLVGVGPKIAGSVQLNISAIPGYNYVIQYNDLLTATNNWATFNTVSSTGSVTTITATDSNTNSSRFYRIKRQPAQ